MSLRDEMVSKALAGYRRGFTPGEMVDDLMPLVERAVDQAASEGWHCGRGSDPDKGEMSQHEADAIVARVTGEGAT